MHYMNNMICVLICRSKQLTTNPYVRRAIVLIMRVHIHAHHGVHIPYMNVYLYSLPRKRPLYKPIKGSKCASFYAYSRDLRT